MGIAIDGVILFEEFDGETGSVGDNLAMSQIILSDDIAKKFVEAFGRAKKQVAIKDGISTGPFLAKASGSTKSAAALLECLQSN